MSAFPLVVLVATLALVTARKVKDKTPPVTIMPSGSSMAETTLAYFSGTDHSEVVLQKVTSKLTAEDIYRYHWETEVPIMSVHLIPPHHIQIDGSERDYAEGIDFTISCTSNSVMLESKHLGFYHMRVVTKKALGRGRRAIEQSSNVILNAGMSNVSVGMCPGESCPYQDKCNNMSKTLFDCPAYNSCSFISEGAKVGPVESFGAKVVVSCTEFVAGVCSKYEQNGNRPLDIVFQARGANGEVWFGPPEYLFDCIKKGSHCYNSVCKDLKGKINSLTILASSVAGGEVGADLIQCLANCLNAEVKAYKKELYVGVFLENLFVWATVKGFEEPCVATPIPVSPSLLPSPSTSSTSATASPTVSTTY